MDYLQTNTKTLKKESLHQSLIKKNLGNLVENEENLQNDWPRRKGVLAGINHFPPRISVSLSPTHRGVRKGFALTPYPPVRHFTAHL
jgi:hypothetical protein